MNLILFHADELEPSGEQSQPLLVLDLARASGTRRVRAEERLSHLRKVLRVTPGDHVKVGLLEGRVGVAVVEEIARTHARLRVQNLDASPPSRPELHLVLALPRPKFLGRILQHVATAGVPRLTLVGSARVERSFWDSSLMAPESIERHLVLGLEQGRDTRLPMVERMPVFEDLVEQLPVYRRDRPVVLAHGDTARRLPASVHGTVLVGPEGGWLDAEVDALERAGAQVRTLGQRPLRVETAVAAVLSRGRTQG